MRENRSRLIFITCTLFSGALLLQMSLYILHVIMDWRMDYNVIELCHTMLQSLGLSSAGYVLQAIIYQTFFIIVFIIGRQAFLTRSFANKVRRFKDEELTRQLNLRYSTANNGITVVKSPAPMALATGMFKPRIVLSTGLLKLLSKSEVRAVLHHEWYHAKSLDPLKTFMLSLFAAALWYIPILKWFLRNYKIVREVLADHYAIQTMGTPAELGSALLKLLKAGIPARMPMSHVSITDTSINQRIRQILEPQTKLQLKWPLASVMISIQVIAMLCTLFIIVLQ